MRHWRPPPKRGQLDTTKLVHHVDPASASYRAGLTLVNLMKRYTALGAGKPLDWPVGDELQRFIQTVGEHWKNAGVPAVVAAELYLTRYKNEIELRRFRPSWLCAGTAASRVASDYQTGQKKVHSDGMQENGVEAGMQELAAELELGHSYTRRVLRAAGVKLDDQNAINQWLLLRMSNVPAVSAAVLSNCHPAVIHAYKEELLEALEFRPALMALLDSMHVNTQPLQSLLNERS